jgi:hypothetical protein
VARLIATDTAIAAKVMQIANSAAFGGGKAVSSIHQAVQYPGELLRAITLTTTLYAPPKGKTMPISLEKLQAASLWTATLRASSSRIAAACERFIAGLLHDVGRIVLAVGMPVEYGAMLAEIKTTAKRPRAERRVLGPTTRASVRSCSGCGRAGADRDAVEYHHEPRHDRRARRDHRRDPRRRGTVEDDDRTPIDEEFMRRGSRHRARRWTELAKASRPSQNPASCASTTS